MSEWIGWNGGECPVHPETLVVVQYDERVYGKAGDFEWVWGLTENLRIIAYRVIKEYKEPKKPRDFWAVVWEGGQCCYRTQDEAFKHAKTIYAVPEDGMIHVREVLDENS